MFHSLVFSHVHNFVLYSIFSFNFCYTIFIFFLNLHLLLFTLKFIVLFYHACSILFLVVHLTGLRICSFRYRSFIICSFRSNQMSHCEQFAQISQDKWATVSKLLRSLRGNERPWANHSGRSRQMSDCEQFAQVAHDKWANERFATKKFG